MTEIQAKPIPGMDVIGRGIYLVPHQPYELKGILFPQDNWRDRHCCETDQTYSLPSGYEVNDSPPMPAGVSLNQMVIEESIERLDKANSIEASVSGGNKAFSVNANASQSGMMRRNANAYYATRTSFLPFWTVYVGDTSTTPAELNETELPLPFKHAHRQVYERFFERFGSHYVKRVWVGGRATLTFSVLKSANISEEEIRMGIKASFGGMASGESNAQMKQQKEKLANNSECTVAGKGGDSQMLAGLSTLDETLYNEWMKTIKSNPQSIELEVAGIWTLISDPEKAEALKSAYLANTVFQPISAVFCLGQEVYFIRDGNYFTYDVDKGESRKPRPLEEKWPQLRELGFDRIDAALSGTYLGGKEVNRLTNKIYLFHGRWFITLDTQTGEFSEPELIKEGWPGVPFERIDAALHFDPDYIYLFSGERFVRFNIAKNQVDEGYPQVISERWEGVQFDKIDAAVYWGNGKVYFFREDRHIRYDVTDFRADPGYPKHVIGSYVGDWKLFV